MLGDLRFWMSGLMGKFAAVLSKRPIEWSWLGTLLDGVSAQITQLKD